MGAQLSDAAYAQPPIVPKNLALALILIACITMGLASFVITLRTYVRLTMKKSAKGWGWDDTFAVLGYGAFLTSSIFAVKAAFYGLGTPDAKLNQFLMVRCAEYMLYSQILYGLSMPFVKASVVFTLLRFTTQKKYRWTLYVMQFIASVMAIIGILASLLYCRPVQGYWNPLLGKCGNFMVVVNIGYAWTAVGIVTDWCCAILPWFVVRKLQMSKRSKVTIIIILGLGAVASTATIVRAPYLKYYLVQENRLYWNGHISIWCILESGIGIIAASLPALRSLFIKYLESTRYGSGNKSTSSKSGYVKRQGSALRTIGGSNYSSSMPLDTLDSLGKGHRPKMSNGKWKRLEDDSSSKDIIFQERTINIESESLSDVEAGVSHKKHEKFAI
ncbi:GPCR, PTH11-type [Zopfia rhizophila CBS 207.26]|uniref:GPCR, PTH11-type n=1 Tax=Zopfia rhizophila CBS 207.26 TaxID=1314779 RepID=A0A6A6DNF8_9PEZI|nr:GPCR, PTH11-type [Zopfia rhizophila CBS 207.26]